MNKFRINFNTFVFILNLLLLMPLASKNYESNYEAKIFLNDSKELYLIDDIDTMNKSCTVKNIFTGQLIKDKITIDRIKMMIPWQIYKPDVNAGPLIYRITVTGKCIIHWVDKSGKIKTGNFSLKDIDNILVNK